MASRIEYSISLLCRVRVVIIIWLTDVTFKRTLETTFPLAARFLFTEWRKISGRKPSDLVFKAQIVQGKEVKQLAQESNTVENAVDAMPTATESTENAANEVAVEEAAATTPAATNSEEAPASESGSIVIPQPELGASLPPVVENAERREVENGRAYEVIFITKAGDADATEASIARMRSLIEDEGGAIDNVRTSEVRRLAYPIKRAIEGVYTVVNARFQTQHMAEIDRFFKLEESVLRHMILREEA